MRIQGMHQGRTFLNDPNAGVAVAVNPPLVTLGQTKPTLQIEIVVGVREFPRADEQAGEEADHDHCHLLMHGVSGTLKSLEQSLKLCLTLHAVPTLRVEGRRNRLDVLDVAAQRRLLGLNRGKAAVDAVGQAV
jgi:hypothetical protein